MLGLDFNFFRFDTLNASSNFPPKPHFFDIFFLHMYLSACDLSWVHPKVDKKVDKTVGQKCRTKGQTNKLEKISRINGSNCHNDLKKYQVNAL